MSSPLPPPSALIFDLDGTLIDSRRDIAAACNHVLAWAGRSPLPEEVIATFVGDGARTLLARAFGMDRGSPELEPLLAEWIRYYESHPVVHTSWMPGAREVLAAVDHLPVALATNKARAVTVRILEALGIRSRFSAVWAGGDGALKPNPEPIHTIAATLSVDVERTWVIGDGLQDVGAGQAAGAVTIAVIGGFHAEIALRAAGPHRLISSLHELPPLLTTTR